MCEGLSKCVGFVKTAEDLKTRNFENGHHRICFSNSEAGINREFYFQAEFSHKNLSRHLL
jgi:hypothetical protein